MSIAPIGHGQGSSVAPNAFQQRDPQRDGLRALEFLGKLQELREASRKQAAKFAAPGQPGAAQALPPGWTTAQSMPKGWTNAMTQGEGDPHSIRLKRPAGLDSLSAGEQSRGTTQTLSPSDRNRLVGSEAAGRVYPQESFTRRNIYTPSQSNFTFEEHRTKRNPLTNKLETHSATATAATKQEAENSALAKLSQAA